jgi:hypothetical protein
MAGKRKKLIAALVIGLLAVGISIRIYYVNKNARLPEINTVAQGDTVTFRGLEYRVLGATLWDYDDYFIEYPDLIDYKDTETEYKRKILLVECQIVVVDDENVFDTYIPIKYEDLFNGTDTFMVRDMNPSLVSDELKSGETLLIPYEIYEENLTKEQWNRVEALDIEYDMVLGTYPVKNELMVTDIKEARPSEEEN